MIDIAVAIIDGQGGVLRDDGGVRPIYSIAKTFIAAQVMALMRNRGIEPNLLSPQQPPGADNAPAPPGTAA